MGREYSGQLGTLDQIAHLIKAALSIELDELEQLVQEAHECATDQKEAPEEQFPVSRQALRMFWRFRMYLGAVDEPVRSDVGRPT